MRRRIIVGLFIIFILGIAIFLLYRSGFREGQVGLKIEAPGAVTAGEEIEYKLIVENKNNFDLRDTKLLFTYPEGSIPLSQDGQPLNSLVSNLNISSLESRDKKEFVLGAILTGEKGEVKKAKANFTYSPSSIRSTFQKSTEAATTISKLSIPLTLSAPPSILSGQRVGVSLDLRNETENKFENLQIVFSYPDGFIFKKATPSSDESNNIFNLTSLKPGEGKRITVEGDVSGFENESKRFTVVLRKKFGEKFYDFQKAQTMLTVSTPFLITEVLVNGTKDYIAKAGEKLKYTVKFSNKSNNNFSALELNAKLEGQMFEFANLKTNGFFDQNTRTILWNAATESLLANLAPNQGGEVSFEVDLKQDFPKVFGKNYSLKVSSLIQTMSIPPDFDLDKISASADLITKIRSKTDFTSKAFYNDSVFSNSGPMPPRVGQKTTYTIHWKIVNEGNDLTGVRIVSSLLPGISWENKFKVTPSQSNLDYNPTTGQVLWEVSTVPAGTGVTSTVFEAVFQVGITPSINQKNQAPEILKETTFEAVDNFTKEKINLSQPSINTQTISDSPGSVQ